MVSLYRESVGPSALARGMEGRRQRNVLGNPDHMPGQWGSPWTERQHAPFWPPRRAYFLGASTLPGASFLSLGRYAWNSWSSCSSTASKSALVALVVPRPPT